MLKIIIHDEEDWELVKTILNLDHINADEVS